MDASRHYADERKAALDRDAWRCVRCGVAATECAHMIPNRVYTRREHGLAIINSRYNIRASCSVCNPYIQLPSYGWAAHALLVQARIGDGAT